MADADQYCQEKAAPRGSDLYYSLLFLAPEKRRALTAFHALCRELDDVADDCRDAQVARLKLAWWGEEIDRLFAGAARHPVGRALAPLAAAGAIAREEFREIIEGTAMNLEIIAYPDFNTLQLYCRRTAGMACQIMAQLLGGQERATIGYAQELGVALRLTRMIRDVGTDARRGRVYLPADELAQFGVAAADIPRARLACLPRPHGTPVSARRRPLRARPGCVAARRPQGPAGRAGPGRYPPRPAARNTARRISGPGPALRAHAAAQTLARRTRPCRRPHAMNSGAPPKRPPAGVTIHDIIQLYTLRSRSQPCISRSPRSPKTAWPAA